MRNEAFFRVFRGRSFEVKDMVVKVLHDWSLSLGVILWRPSYSVACCVCEDAGSECRWTLQRHSSFPGPLEYCALVFGPVRQESGFFDSMHWFAFKLSTHGSNWRMDAIVPNPFHPNIVIFCDARSCLCTVWEVKLCYSNCVKQACSYRAGKNQGGSFHGHSLSETSNGRWLKAAWSDFASAFLAENRWEKYVWCLGWNCGRCPIIKLNPWA